MKVSNEEIENWIAVFCVGQSFIHSLDKVEDSKLNVREIKQTTKRLCKLIDKHLDNFGSNMDDDEMEYYNKIVAELDAVTGGLKIEKIEQ